MGIFGLTFERRYSFGNDARGLTSDEILTIMGRDAWKQQQAYYPYSLSYLNGLAQYQPPQRPLDERFADFKDRLAAALKRAGLPYPKDSA